MVIVFSICFFNYGDDDVDNDDSDDEDSDDSNNHSYDNDDDEYDEAASVIESALVISNASLVALIGR
jgi:hypothetical protein